MDYLAGFRPDSRLWIYAFPKRLNSGELAVVRRALNEFVDDWKSHQVDVRGAYEVVYDQFVLLAGESENGISGCSIDSSVSVFKWLREHAGLDALDRSQVFYRAGDEIRSRSRPEFQRLVDSGEITAATIVFNNALTKIGELHSGRWELPFAESWHAVAFTHR